MEPEFDLDQDFSDLVTYEAAEELCCGEKSRERDRHRWELDPASAEDYGDHGALARGSAMRWRHFGH